jgi:hypothetical protein
VTSANVVHEAAIAYLLASSQEKSSVASSNLSGLVAGRSHIFEKLQIDLCEQSRTAIVLPEWEDVYEESISLAARKLPNHPLGLGLFNIHSNRQTCFLN